MESLSNEILSSIDKLALKITNRQFEQFPQLEARYGAIGRQKCTEDARYHLKYLSAALKAESPLLFVKYIEWAQLMLQSRNIPANDLLNNLHIINEVLNENLESEGKEVIDSYLKEAIGQLEDKTAEPVSYFTDTNPYLQLAKEFHRELLASNLNGARSLIINAVENGTPVKDIYMHVFQPSQYETGRLWQENKITVADEHYCTAATQTIMSQLFPYIFSNNRNGYRLMAICVSNELHELGLRIITDLFEMEGWDTLYLGANTPSQGLLNKIEATVPDLLLISATIPYHVHQAAEIINLIKNNESLNKKPLVMVGGYPFNIEPVLWKKVGADASAQNAEEALITATELIRSKTS